MKRYFNEHFAFLNRIKLYCVFLLSFSIQTLTWADSLSSLEQQEKEFDSQSSVYENLQQRVDELLAHYHQQPNDSKNMLELALAYYKIKQYDKSLILIEKVLLDENIPKNVRKNALRFKKRVQELLKKVKNNPLYSPVKGDITFFVGNDSNANVAPGRTDLEIGTLLDSSTAQYDEFRGFSIYLQHYNLLKDNIDSGTLWRNRLTLINRDYLTIDNADLQVLRGSSELIFKQLQWIYSLRAKYENIRLSGQNLAHYFTFNPYFDYKIEQTTFRIAPSFVHRRYVHMLDEDKNGNQRGFELFASTKDWLGFTARVGISYRDLNINADYHSYNSSKASLYLLKNLSDKWFLNALFSYENNNYVGIEQYYSDQRSDKVYRGIVGFKYSLRKNLFLGIKFNLSKRDSNHDLHSYHRVRVEADLGYRF